MFLVFNQPSKSQSLLVFEVNVFDFSGWTFISPFPSKCPSVNLLPALLVHLCEGGIKRGGSQAPYCRTSAAFGGVGPGGHAVQVLVAPPPLRRPHSSITMCSLSKLCSTAGSSHCWLATALATCFVALCKSVHTGTQAREGGILSSGAGIEKGGRPINESLP